MSDNTVFLRLAGPMQSWGTSSRFQLRRTDAYPSKSGVLGLLLCALGVRREDSAKRLEALVPLSMGVRVDRRGTLDWDYHTAGGGHGDGAERAIGIRSAEGKIKKTQATGEFETLLSRRQYLWDASFLVALRGLPETISKCAAALDDPVWPVFLGRKCCIPAEPVLAGTGTFASLQDALSSLAWQPRVAAVDGGGRPGTPRKLDCFFEHTGQSVPPDGATLVHDVPAGFGFYNHGPRFVMTVSVSVPVGVPTYPRAPSRVYVDPYGPGWDVLRQTALERDQGLCVFCKSHAIDVHHVDYADIRLETLRSLCKICHDACTMLEYGSDMHQRRIDPSDPSQRAVILQQINRLVVERRLGRRRELLESARAVDTAFFNSVFDRRAQEGR